MGKSKRKRKEADSDVSSAEEYAPTQKRRKDGDSEEEEEDAIDETILGADILQETMDDGPRPIKDYMHMKLKDDHMQRPLWVCEDGRIFLESFHKHYQAAYDFLVAISEPVCRPELIHEYQLTANSLYAAVSVGLSGQTIIDQLNILSKVPISTKIEKDIRDSTLNFGKVKLVLRHNEFSLESTEPEVLALLLRDETIADARLRGAEGVITKGAAPAPVVLAGTGKKQADAAKAASIATGGAQDENGEEAEVSKDTETAAGHLEQDEEDETLAAEVHSFRVDPQKIQLVRKRCIELKHPALEEYDFRNDKLNKDLPIELKPTTAIRPYQEKSLSKMFGGGRARSGMIVLPCGAGKTLVGITAACTVKKSVLVLCTSGVAVEQWKRQFELWTDIDPKYISRFTAETRELPQEVSITISTYPMIATSYERRAAESKAVMDRLTRHEWGLLLLDEVHVVPAKMFRAVCTNIHAHSKLGLTATLVREDGLIGDLYYLIGPKLYEANWMDLQNKGYIARVQCVEVWCTMAPAFYRQYLKEKSRKRKFLWVMNPEKFRACKCLVQVHEERGDKILIFSDDVFALKEYGRLLGKDIIYGKTPTAERVRILQNFTHGTSCNTIGISKVGDNSIDLPEANVIIQISSHFGSRRQEAQRLGRILRKKPGVAVTDQFNAFFYSLVSKDTQEMYYSSKRQQFLIDQGYAFKVVTHLPVENVLPLTEEQQIDILQKCLRADLKEAEDALNVEDDVNSFRRPKVSRSRGSMGALSGADGMSYMEYSKGSMYEKTKTRNPLFAARQRRFEQAQKERRKAEKAAAAAALRD